MSEILETNQVVTEPQSQDMAVEEKTENNEIKDNVNSSKEDEVSNEAEDAKSISDENNYEGLVKFLSDYSQKMNEVINEFNSRRDYLVTNLAKYDTEDYLQNEDFKNLYAEAFNSLGTNLDTEKFINLVDKYVNSRLNSYSKKIAIGDENTSLTDGLNFENGEHKNTERTFKLQDIPADQLEKYIEKYI